MFDCASLHKSWQGTTDPWGLDTKSLADLVAPFRENAEAHGLHMFGPFRLDNRSMTLALLFNEPSVLFLLDFSLVPLYPLYRRRVTKCWRDSMWPPNRNGTHKILWRTDRIIKNGTSTELCRQCLEATNKTKTGLTPLPCNPVLTSYVYNNFHQCSIRLRRLCWKLNQVVF